MEVFSYQDAVALLKKHKLPLAESHLVKTSHQALSVASTLGFPVVAKLISANVIHKTEKKAVLVNIKDAKELRQSWTHLSKIDPNAEGILIQKQLHGVELFAGVHPDPVFGPVIAFGLGGILVETLKNVRLGIAPLQKKDAQKLIEKSAVFPLLSGYRGQKIAPIEEVVSLLCNLSALAVKNPSLSVDLNPIFAVHGHLHAVDWRVLK